MRLLAAILLCVVGLSASTLSSRAVDEPLPHDAYIWQRLWTPAVIAAARRSADIVRTWRVLLAEADRSGRWTNVAVAWSEIRATGRPIVAVVRIDGRLDETRMAAMAEHIASTVEKVPGALAGVEIDYDCPTSKLPTYTRFLAALRSRLPPALALSITALPTWMGSPHLDRLAVDLTEVVLQVHAVEDPRRGLFDPARAERWVRDFGRRIGRPFRVALPVYDIRVTWQADGRLASVEGEVPLMTASPDAEPGIRELRLETPAGLTNPLVFQIGRLPEVVRKPVADDDLPGRQPLRKLKEEGRSATGEQPVLDVQLPTIVNGQILSGQVDRYRFSAKKGQHLVLAVSAQQLVPYIADAVPGWFQATIKLCDERGEELAYAGSYRFHPDPVLHYEVPHDGNYVVEINDSVFRGREDFVYRMALGELPFVTSIFPLGGRAGETTRVAAQGWNLPFASLTMDATGKSVGIDPPETDRRYGLLNSQPFALDSLPECFEQEPNDSPAQAQRVTLPVIINGRIDHCGDRDVFRFEGKAGQAIVAEVYARRLDSPLDSVLKLTDSAGRQLAFNDDHEDKACGLVTHHADSWLRAILPAAGTYYLHLYDAQNQGGPEYAYRLRISPPRPDFDLRVVPSSINARAGAAVPIGGRLW